MNSIHPTAIIGEGVNLGSNNEILPFTILSGPLVIGDGNIIGPHVVIGSPGQDTRNPRYDSSNASIEIGSNNIFREFTAIQKPCYREVTRLGSNIFLMQSVHIPHDAILEDGVVLTPMCVLGGISTIMQSATIGMGATVHQYCVVGPFSMVATGAAVTKNVKPFSRHIPGKPISVNRYAIEKYGWVEQYAEIEAYVKDGELPHTEPLKVVVDRYMSIHADSGRGEY